MSTTRTPNRTRLDAGRPVRVLEGFARPITFAVVRSEGDALRVLPGTSPGAVAVFTSVPDAATEVLAGMGADAAADALGLKVRPVVEVEQQPAGVRSLAGRLGAVLRIGQMCGATAFPSAECLAGVLAAPMWIVEAGLREYGEQQQEVPL